ncbi:DUF2089-like zinc ribbon domain-containing protein [Clostridium estertheticum]|uniref:DUF2089-like zinc ribbon domain-containing protein n=1 Tax=Clostridium estertheticum TaxID=238834 RepID=UPI001C7D2F5C|nr:DUF2089 family protein [Clostridium estertheticum]MBX4266696.1 DUF2089 domain-containing protein [Clostridium estertheticum]WLC88184.1 DUF2089 domain-containing protein [Clostridium estertheticum]
MAYKIITQCPVCSSKLTVTKLKCKKCDTVIENDFELSKFSYLTMEQLNFVEVFIKCRADTPTPQGVGFLDTLTSQILSSIKDLINYTYKNSLISLKLLLPITLMNELAIALGSYQNLLFASKYPYCLSN